MADLRIHNVFMVRKRPDYVKSGLQLWLDGIDNTRHGHDATATGWEDISGNNYDFVPYTAGKSPTINANCYSGFASDTFLKCSNSTLIGYSNATQAGTLEVVFHYGSGQIIGFRNVSGNNIFAKLAVLSGTFIVNGKYSSSGASRYRTTESPVSGVINSVSITYTSAVTATKPKFNGTEMEIEQQTTGWGNNGGDVYVGARVHTNSTNHYPFSNKIYCIRYYNRILTAEEQAHNRRIDIARFNAYNG